MKRNLIDNFIAYLYKKFVIKKFSVFDTKNFSHFYKFLLLSNINIKQYHKNCIYTFITMQIAKKNK